MKIKWFCLVLCAGLNLSLLQQKAYAESEYSYGFKIKLPVMEARFAANEKDTNFGVHAFSDKFSPVFPVSLKVGNLSPGGIISKMNRPSISGIGSPFSTGVSSVAGITAELPGISSFSKPVSCFFQLGYNNKKSAVSKLFFNGWYSPEEEMTVFSGIISSNLFSGKVKLKNSFAAGIFPYDENNSTSWFINRPYYSSGNHFTSCCSFSLEFLKLYFMVTLNSYESPFGTMANLWKTDLKYSGTHFIFSLSGVYIPGALITSSDQKLAEGFQFRTALQYKDTLKLKRPLFIKTGVAAFLSQSAVQDELTAKLTGGLQFRYGITFLSMSATLNSKMETADGASTTLSFESLSLFVSNSYSFPVISTTLSFSSTLTPAENFSYLNTKFTGKLQVNYTENPKISNFASFTAAQKKGAISSQSISFGSNFELKLQYMVLNFKVSVDLPI